MPFSILENISLIHTVLKINFFQPWQINKGSTWVSWVVRCF